jgi:hypothetical protein
MFQVGLRVVYFLSILIKLLNMHFLSGGVHEHSEVRDAKLAPQMMREKQAATSLAVRSDGTPSRNTVSTTDASDYSQKKF